MATKAKEEVKTPVGIAEEIYEIAQLGRGGVWLKTTEMLDAIDSINSLSQGDGANKKNCRVLNWNCVEGLDLEEKPQEEIDTSDPFANLKKSTAQGSSLNEALEAFQAECDIRGHMQDEQLMDAPHFIMLVRNGHREIVNNQHTNKDAMTRLQLCIESGKVCKCLIVFVAHAAYEVPNEINDLVWHLQHKLPNTAERREIISQIQTAGTVEKPSAAHMDRIANITGGLTRNQVEGVVSMSYKRHRKLCDMEISMHKANLINEGGLLKIHEPEGGFETLGGLTGIKTFLKQVMRKDRPKGVQAKGVLLLGVPGVGKSHLAKALGAELQRPTVSLDVGALMGGIVGQTEERTRQALDTIDSISPCVSFIDEVEKALGGAASGGDNDSGVGSRMFGSLLTWLNDHKSDVFFIATANDVSRLPKEFTRAERFDGIFFIDQPSAESREMIWDIYLKQYEIPKKFKRPDDRNWTGAEIKSCCRLSRLLDVDLEEASEKVVPVAITAAEQIKTLRQWANNRCIDADTGKRYVYNATKTSASSPHSQASKKKVTKKKATRKRSVVS